MSVLNGESESFSIENGYENAGGVAMYSVGNGGETVSGGSSEEGQYNSIFRIYWTITYDGGDSYTGGITGVSWYLDNALSPFYGVQVADIWNAALPDSNLSEYFGPWNTKTTDGDKVEFLSVLTDGCYKLSLGQ